MAALHEEDPTFLTAWIRNCTKPSFPRRASCIWKSWWTDCAADSTPRRTGRAAHSLSAKRSSRPGDSKYRHKKQTGGAGQFAEVWMKIEPLPRDSGVEFTESLSGQNVDRVFVPSVEEGVKNACREGILAGYKVVDVKVDFYDGKMHPVDSKDIAFQIAGYFAFKEAFLKAPALPARADSPHRSPHSRRLPGQSHGRHLQPARAASWASMPKGNSRSSARRFPRANFINTPACSAP